MTLLAFSGSPRPQSAVGHLLRAAMAAALAGNTCTFYEDTLAVPLFSPDLDAPESPTPPTVAALRARLHTADAVVIATPEYAYGMPGSLKNALDWLVSTGSFYGKPTSVLSAAPSEGGGERARASLLLTLEALGAAVVPAASFPVPLVRTKLNVTGEVTDTAFATHLSAAMAALIAAVPVARFG